MGTCLIYDAQTGRRSGLETAPARLANLGGCLAQPFDIGRRSDAVGRPRPRLAAATAWADFSAIPGIGMPIDGIAATTFESRAGAGAEPPAARNGFRG